MRLHCLFASCESCKRCFWEQMANLNPKFRIWSAFAITTLYIFQNCKSKGDALRCSFIYLKSYQSTWSLFDRQCFMMSVRFKASAHYFKQFTSRLLKVSLYRSMHLYISDGRHAWFHLHGTSRPDRSASEATKYKLKIFLSTVGLEPSTLRFQVWCSTDWARRAWWMLSIKMVLFCTCTPNTNVYLVISTRMMK